MYVLPIRIYVEDTDYGGVVYHANHLKFMERARTEWLLSIGFSLTDMKETLGSFFVIFKVELKYLKPIYLHELIEVTAVVSEINKSSITFLQTIRSPKDHEHIYCEGEIIVVYIDHFTSRPKPIPLSLREKLI